MFKFYGEWSSVSAPPYSGGFSFISHMTISRYTRMQFGILDAKMKFLNHNDKSQQIYLRNTENLKNKKSFPHSLLRINSGLWLARKILDLRSFPHFWSLFSNSVWQDLKTRIKEPKMNNAKNKHIFCLLNLFHWEQNVHICSPLLGGREGALWRNSLPLPHCWVKIGGLGSC